MTSGRRKHEILQLIFIGCCAVFPYFVNSSYNIAKGKQASQSSDHGGWGATKAVDGIIGKDLQAGGGGSCSSTLPTGSRDAWWMVDLQQMSRIKTINIRYRQLYSFRLSGFYLYVSNTTVQDSLRSTWHLCYHDDTKDPDLPSLNQSRSCPVDGKYVIFYNRRPADNGPKSHRYYSKTEAVVELCEVQVFGCPVRRFGPACMTTCHCGFGGCDPDTGLCDVTGCQSGWMGTSCSEECINDMFGVDCSHTCHCSKVGCDRETGSCIVQGCEAGWHGSSCDQKCGTGNFGNNCSQTCHCVLPGCDRFSGSCTNPGCEPGWTGMACDKACNISSFGNNCDTICHCTKPGCDRFTGLCNVTGCAVGWTGLSCDKAVTLNSKDNAINSEKLGSSALAGYALLGSLLFISIGFNTVFIIDRLRTKRKESERAQSDNEMQYQNTVNVNENYDILDTSKVEPTNNIYDTVAKKCG